MKLKAERSKVKENKDINNKLLEKIMNRRYFFDAGLQFSCQQCGHCCTGEPGTIYVSQKEIALIAKHLKLTNKKFIQEYCYPYKDSYSIKEHDDGRCYFFENGCKIYKVRPKQCQTYPFWKNNVRSEKAWNAVKQECPGVDQGRLYTKEEILEKL